MQPDLERLSIRLFKNAANLCRHVSDKTVNKPSRKRLSRSSVSRTEDGESIRTLSDCSARNLMGVEYLFLEKEFEERQVAKGNTGISKAMVVRVRYRSMWE